MSSNRIVRNRSRTRVAEWAVAALAALIVAVPPALGAAEEEDDQMVLRRAQAVENVDAARAQVTFPFLMPTWLPDGYSLEHIAWLSPHESTGTTASSIDSWYSAPGMPFIHIWQTDNPDLAEKDPVALGNPLEIAGASSWSAVTGVQGMDTDAATILSTRMPDGTTVSVDSGIALDQLIKVVESLAADDPR